MNVFKLFLLGLTVISSVCASQVNILMVVTNHGTLGSTGKKTGYYLPEVSHPYYKFKKAGFNVVFASPKGGKAPMDPKSKDLSDAFNKKFFMDKKIMARLDKTISLKNVKADDYAAIVFTGGHGTMWDFPNSVSLQNVTTQIYEKGGVVAAVCHGPAALINVKLSNGKYLISGKKVTGFTNKEEEIVKLTKQMPFLLETKMIKRDASFNGAKAWQENVITDQRLVTGQNPASASKLGEEVVKLLRNRK